MASSESLYIQLLDLRWARDRCLRRLSEYEAEKKVIDEKIGALRTALGEFFPDVPSYPPPPLLD